MNDTGKSAKLAKYDRLYEQIKGYIHTTEDIWARLATMEAVLHHKMQTFFWTGVYALIDDELIVRSYQWPARNYGIIPEYAGLLFLLKRPL